MAPDCVEGGIQGAGKRLKGLHVAHGCLEALALGLSQVRVFHLLSVVLETVVKVHDPEHGLSERVLVVYDLGMCLEKRFRLKDSRAFFAQGNALVEVYQGS